MQPTTLAKILNVSSHTLRRWTGIYGRFLSPGASPAKGKPRQLSEHDIRILTFIATLREAGFDLEAIQQRLETEQANGWEGLPELPPEWLMSASTPTVPVELAASRAYEIAQMAVLRKELDHTVQTLQEAQSQVEQLRTELDALRSKTSVSEQEKHELEIKLMEAQARVERLEGQMSAYAFGREKPVNVAVLLAGSLLAGVVLVMIIVIVVTVALSLAP
jgi:DNA-binding transcriptional MerR regulator